LLVTARGTLVDPAQPPAQERLYAARYRYKAVRCGKADCGACPHLYYIYRCWRVDGTARDVYLGPSDEKGDEHELPVLRRPRVAFGASR
jgi:hypothetical protein